MQPVILGHVRIIVWESHLAAGMYTITKHPCEKVQQSGFASSTRAHQCSDAPFGKVGVKFVQDGLDPDRLLAPRPRPPAGLRPHEVHVDLARVLVLHQRGGPAQPEGPTELVLYLGQVVPQFVDVRCGCGVSRSDGVVAASRRVGGIFFGRVETHAGRRRILGLGRGGVGGGGGGARGGECRLSVLVPDLLPLLLLGRNRVFSSVNRHATLMVNVQRVSL
mmetsp:Transcript_41127/g.87636  ORF Transcript_41127/g.87636 Transcript_41127/m.87636 type:complete len:220 (-) Transcript_41127:39-698(-)